jgi:hypothetical protein
VAAGEDGELVDILIDAELNKEDLQGGVRVVQRERV